jgi:hypothetical protein
MVSGFNAGNGLVPGNASAVTEARFHRRGEREQGALARFRYSRLKEACPWLRRTRALCKFNGG